MKTWRLSELERRSKLPAPEEMLLPVYGSSNGMPTGPLYGMTLAELVEAIAQTARSRGEVSLAVTEHGIKFTAAAVK